MLKIVLVFDELWCLEVVAGVGMCVANGGRVGHFGIHVCTVYFLAWWRGLKEFLGAELAEFVGG